MLISLPKIYNSFQKVLYPSHTTYNTWLLRYITNSWMTSPEFEWARQNITNEYKSPDKLGESVEEIEYKSKNDEGASIHSSKEFYNDKPRTLQILKEYGAVCGGISWYGSGMTQAHGIPAVPYGQPGHCAFLWLKGSEWELGYDISGILKSTAHWASTGHGI